jgi:hypothetical protein
MPTTKSKPAPKPKPQNTHGGYRPGAGVKPKPRYCEKCGTLCPSATEARAHCAGGSLMA